MMEKNIDPSIEGRNGDLPGETEHANCAGMLEILSENRKNKTQRIRTKGDHDIRQNCMRMTAGLTGQPGNKDCGIGSTAILYGDKMTRIMAPAGKMPPSVAGRTDGTFYVKTLKSLVKEVLI